MSAGFGHLQRATDCSPGIRKPLYSASVGLTTGDYSEAVAKVLKIDQLGIMFLVAAAVRKFLANIR